MKKVITVTIAFLIVLNIGCKTKDPKPASKTKTQLLTEKAWLLKSYEEKLNGIWVKDTSAPSHETDNLYII